MTIDKPTPGNTLAKIDELIDVVNASSGGGGFFDLFQSLNDATQTHLIHDDVLVFKWNPDLVAPGLFSRSYGTAVTWAGVGDPTKININIDGYYDLMGNLVVNKGSEDFTFTLGIQINGSQIGSVMNGSAVVLATYTNTFTVASHTAYWGIQLSAGDYVEFYGLQGGNDSDDNGVQLVNCTVRRVA